MSVAERSAARQIRRTARFSLVPVVAATALAAGLVAGCASSSTGHPVAASPGATRTPPAAQSQRDAVQALSDEGPVQVVHGTRSTVIINSRSGIDASDLARRVDAALPVATGFWRAVWTQAIVVVVPGSLAHWQTLTGLRPDADVAAVSLGASSVEASSGSASGGQRIVINPEAYARLSDAGRGVVLRHEVEHLVSASHTPPGMPAWLVEGTADVVGFSGSGIPVRQAAEELTALVRRSRPPASLPTDADFSGRSSSVAYEEGWLACRLIDREKGAAALRTFYEDVAAGIRAQSGSFAAGQLASVVSTAMQRATGWSLPDFVARWRADLHLELGSAA